MKRILIFLAAFAVTGMSHAENISARARLSAGEVPLNGTVTLTLEVIGASNIGGAPVLEIPDFQVQRAGQTQSYQWVNGQSSSLTAYNFLLSPTRAGTLQVPALTMTIAGQTVTTEPLTLVVRADGGPATGSAPAPSEGSRRVDVPSEGLRPLFMTASVDIDRAYVGQQIVLKIQFLRRPDVQLASQAQYSEPDITGFLVEPLQQREYTTTLNGTQYVVNELPYALFPTSDGQFAIGSAQIQVAVRRRIEPFDANSFFQNFFGQSEVARLNTRAIPITVRELPKNRPAEFSGAVGRFKMSARVDGKDAEVGKPINLILTVEGVGNIKAVKEPVIPEMVGFRRYETISNSNAKKDGSFLHGSKEFKTLIIPQVSGALTIPSATLAFFDPSRSEYVLERTREITLQVKPGTLAAGEASGEPMAGTAPGLEGVRVVQKDIRFQKTGDVKPVHPPLYRRGVFMIANSLPPLFALVAFLMQRQSQRRQREPVAYRSRVAFKTAKKRLSKARKLQSDPDPVRFYGALHEAIANFLADKLSFSAAGLVWEDLEQRLITRDVPAELRADIRDIFDRADMARFATSSFSDEARAEAWASADQLLTRLEEIV